MADDCPDFGLYERDFHAWTQGQAYAVEWERITELRWTLDELLGQQQDPLRDLFPDLIDDI